MYLGIIYLIYNFFKITAIVINLLINKKKLIIPYTADEDIKKELIKKNYKIKKNINNNPYNDGNNNYSNNAFESTNQTQLKSNFFDVSD